MFGLVAMTAVAINLFVQFLVQNGINQFIIYGLTVIEYIIFTADLIVFLKFIYRTTIRMWKFI